MSPEAIRRMLKDCLSWRLFILHDDHIEVRHFSNTNQLCNYLEQELYNTDMDSCQKPYMAYFWSEGKDEWRLSRYVYFEGDKVKVKIEKLPIRISEEVC